MEQLITYEMKALHPVHLLRYLHSHLLHHLHLRLQHMRLRLLMCLVTTYIFIAYRPSTNHA
jgi:hypothetical protein